MDETQQPIDINSASPDDLTQLPGIGPALAGRIVAYRTAVKPFGAVDDLGVVPGISARMLDVLRERLVVTSAAAPEREPVESWDALGETGSESAAVIGEKLVPVNVEEASAVAEESAVGDAAARKSAADEAEPAGVPAPDATLQLTAPDVLAALPAPGAAGNDALDEAGAGPAAANVEAAAADTAGTAESDSDSDVPDAGPTDLDDDVLSAIHLPPPMEPPADPPVAAVDPVPALESDARTEPEPAPPPAPAPPAAAPLPTPVAAPVRERGGCFTAAVAVLGALIGAALTLVLLAALNGGTLRFAPVTNVEAVDQLRGAQNSTETELRAVDDDVQSLQAQTEQELNDISSGLATIAAAGAGNEASLGTVAADAARLQATASALESDIEQVGAVADDFGILVNGLRDLLDDLESVATPTGTPTPTLTPTPTAVETALPATGTPRSTATPRATRTPRPSATPFVTATPLPTGTPVPTATPVSTATP